MNPPLHLILLAGGQGLRATGSDSVPKQFRPTGRGILFAVSLREFLTLGADGPWQLASLTVVAAEPWRDTVAAELQDLTLPWQIAPPGRSRTGSTWNATRALAETVAPAPADLVAVHDAARPFASAALLAGLAEAALQAGGAIPGVPVPDTIVEVKDGTAAYLRREVLQAVQTPQVFRWSLFEPAHRWAHESLRVFTDDGGLLAAHGQEPAVVPGDPDNWKVTSAADWVRAADLLKIPDRS
jgi:2-C-methyl-D-erythritol 4-phosphate cytidylyltransferase/2-C-methyl-D-erythritol 2,4-cyclodiphosphate synthase